MAEKRFSLTGKSYHAAKGGMVHKGAQGTVEDFKNWLGDDGYKKASKAKHFIELEASDEKPKAKTRGPNKSKTGSKATETDADEGTDEGSDGDGADESNTGGSATGGAQRA